MHLTAPNAKAWRPRAGWAPSRGTSCPSRTSIRTRSAGHTRPVSVAFRGPERLQPGDPPTPFHALGGAIAPAPSTRCLRSSRFRDRPRATNPHSRSPVSFNATFSRIAGSRAVVLPARRRVARKSPLHYGTGMGPRTGRPPPEVLMTFVSPTLDPPRAGRGVVPCALNAGASVGLGGAGPRSLSAQPVARRRR